MSRPTPNPLAPHPRSVPRAGTVGVPDVDPRGAMLDRAGVTEDMQAQAVRKAFEKKVALLEAKEVRHFAFNGEVIDQREVEASGVQLKAAQAIDAMVGVMAPPSTRKVTVVHTLEWPEWYKAPGAQDTMVIEAVGDGPES